MEVFVSRLNELLKLNSISRYKLARSLSVNPQTVAFGVMVLMSRKFLIWLRCVIFSTFRPTICLDCPIGNCRNGKGDGGKFFSPAPGILF